MLQANFIPSIEQFQTGAGHCLSRSQKFGLMIENWVAGELESQGHATTLLNDFNARYDILCNGRLPIEVKAAKPYPQFTGRSWRDRWQFRLTGGLDYRKQDFVYVLVCVDSAGVIYPYVIPSAHVGARATICLTSHPKKYGGWLRQYLNAWHFIGVVENWRRRLAGDQAGPVQVSIFDYEVWQ